MVTTPALGAGDSSQDPFQSLAAELGIQTSYHDVEGRLRQPPTEAIIAIMRAQGVAIDGEGDAPVALETLRKDRQRIVEPVVVAWDGYLEPVAVSVASGQPPVIATVVLESGDELALGFNERSDTVAFQESGWALPLGYHKLVVQVGGDWEESTVISAPRACWPFVPGEHIRGVWAPLYALWSSDSLGAGNLTDLKHLSEHLSALADGHPTAIGILPVLATHNEASDPSPYTPSSRLFWDEFYLDLTAIEELSDCQAAQDELANSESVIADFRNARIVDYAKQAHVQRSVLAPLAEWAFAQPAIRQDLESFIDASPQVCDYAGFRAAGEEFGSDWKSWPADVRRQPLERFTLANPAVQYHVYAQWLMHRQLGALRESMRTDNVNLYLDFPVGIYPRGYDAWRERDIHLDAVEVGAAPDPGFPQGQNWGFPSLSPWQSRLQGHRYFASGLRRQMQVADVLRIDHVMALHRLYWIPNGFETDQGTYVHYPQEELCAVLCLESVRNQCHIVGENLGTVPPEVDRMLEDHGISPMYIIEYELAEAGTDATMAGPTTDNELIGINTHDMATFAGFWSGSDIDERVALGQLTPTEVEEERSARTHQKEMLLRTLNLNPDGDLEAGLVFDKQLAYLAQLEAPITLVALEDFWLETKGQNMPNTASAHRPNWQQKCQLDLEAIADDPTVTNRLQILLG